MTPLDEINLTQQQRIALLLQYFGPAFSGNQLQHNAYTVQQALSEAFTHLKVPHGAICFAGRTDAGVHAKAQVAHVDVAGDALNRIKDLRSALNATLPQTVSIESFTLETTDGFHATIKPQYRWYQYRILNQSYRSVWMPADTVLEKTPLDSDKMADAAARLQGEHDFASFKCPRSEIDNNTCRVLHSQIYRQGDEVVFNIVANRFIYKMVRNIVGTLLVLGKDRAASASDIEEILAAQNRQMAGPTAQPYGLSFMAAAYPAPWDYFQNHVYVTKLNQLIQESSPHETHLLRKAS